MAVTEEAKEVGRGRREEEGKDEDMDEDRKKCDAESEDVGNEECQEASREDDGKEAVNDEGRNNVQGEPDAPMEDRKQAKPAEQGVVEEMPTAEPKTRAAKVSTSRRKEKSAPKGPDLPAMALKIKRLQDEASEIDAAIATNRK